MQVSVKRGFPSPKWTRYASRPKSKSVVLLDFDGVVTNNHIANTYVSRKIVDVVKYVTGVSDEEKSKALNTNLYMSHGHTWLGLRNIGYDISLKEFNDRVYGDTCEYNSLCLTQQEVFSMFSLMMRSMNMDVDVMFFSNADTRWLTQFIKWNATLYAVQDHVMSNNEVLKPTMESYSKVHEFLNHHGYQKVFFIDDKLDNVESAPENWHKIWYTMHDQHQSVHVCPSLKTACELMSRLR